jgi:diguanylate cyclase (GGDEF)-like protein
MYKRVLAVCEESHGFRELKYFLHVNKDFELVAAGNLAEALTKIEGKIDVALLDLAASQAEQSRVIRALRTRAYSTPILLICEPGQELPEADECLPRFMTPPSIAQRILAHALMREEREMLLESNRYHRRESEKFKKIHFLSLEYANMIENDLMDRMKTLAKVKAGAQSVDGEMQRELEVLRAENGKLQLEIEKLDVILSSVVSHDAVLEDQMLARLKVSSEPTFRDPLTKIYNRRKFNEELIKDYAAMGESRLPLSLIMFDIDNFKNVNDDYGHIMGDEVLRTVARIVGEALPQGSVFARWGGEEFAVIAPAMDLKSAAGVAEKLRRVIREARAAGIVQVTCSFGVIQVEEDEEPQSLLQRLDSSLYAAKRDGRDCVRTGTKRKPRWRVHD